jgi:hypothetical protein
VFLAEAAGFYGLDKIKMQELEEVLALDEVAAKVIDEATGGGGGIGERACARSPFLYI